MAEKDQFASLLRASRGDAVVLTATFLVVVFRDLTTGILVGFILATLLFMHRMAHAVDVQQGAALLEDDMPDSVSDGTRPFAPGLATDPDVIVYRISGAFFFGAASGVAAALDRIGEHPKAYVIDFSAVSVIDSSAAATIEGFVRKAIRQHAVVYVAGAQPLTRKALLAQGVKPPNARFVETIKDAVQEAHARVNVGVQPVPA